MRATFKLLNSYFWKTIYGPVISLLIPLMLLLILGNIFKIQYIYPGIIALSFLFIGLLSLPLGIMELKRSALFKYIGTSPINPIRFTIVSVLYFIFVAIAASFTIFFATMIFFHDQVFPSDGFSRGILGGIYSSAVGFFSFYISAGIHLVFVILCGLAISTFSKTPQQALTIGITIIIPSMFLSGIILPVNIIAESKPLNWISRFIPFRYSTGNMVIASTPLNQLGDMVSRMSVSQKQLLFQNVIDSKTSTTFKIGDYINPDQSPDYLGYKKYEQGDIVIKYIDDSGYTKNIVGKSLDDLIKIRDFIKPIQFENKAYNIHDPALYRLTIQKVINSNALHSDNNIFKLNQEWAVERMPQLGAARDFIQDYFRSYKSGDGSASGDFSRLKPIAKQITDGKFDWLNIFLKQTNTLYYIPDRALNLFVPIIFSSVGIYYIVNNFKWSVR